MIVKDYVCLYQSMAAKNIDNSTGIDIEIASIVSQILSEILDSSADQPEPSTSNGSSHNHTLNNPTCSNQLQEGDCTNIHPTPSKLEANQSTANEIQLPYQTCTVKEMLSEILDCTIIRRPSSPLPSTSAMRSDRNLPGSPSPPPEYVFDSRVIPRHIYMGRRGSNDSVTSRVHCTVKEVFSELMDHTVFTKADRQMNAYDYSRPGTSRTMSEQFERRENVRAYEVYRSLGAGIVNSTNAIHDEFYLQNSSALSVRKILPSYSSVIKMGPAPKAKPVCSSCSFVPRKPPPSYAEVEGIWEDSPSLISSESAVFGPDPTYMICPRCRTAVVTNVQVHRSVMTHLVALFLCLCLCWPCCLMPYCLRSCNYSHHSCPHCSYYFGMYRPF